MQDSLHDDEAIKGAVRQNYGSVARAGLSSEHAGMRSIAQAFGYTVEELAAIPAASNMGLSCGNPVALASLRPGETVVDLGSGGGLDVFLASRAVGPEGHAIGIDMTPDMVALARRNAAQHGYTNVRFHLAELEATPLPADSVDCVLSNCVLNLCPDKPAALREVFRMLKPGGRVAISDIALKQALPAPIAREIAAWTGCIAGAQLISDLERALDDAGFVDVFVQDSGADLNAYRDGGHAACCGPAAETTEPAEVAPSACCTPAPAGASACCAPPAATPTPCAPADAAGSPDFHASMGALLDSFDVNAYAASVKVYARKPE
ncbi:MAG: arsenite methyltransferase [Planctomycetota bacterium]